MPSGVCVHPSQGLASFVLAKWSHFFATFHANDCVSLDFPSCRVCVYTFFVYIVTLLFPHLVLCELVYITLNRKMKYILLSVLLVSFEGQRKANSFVL
jgi:hypothetical protein